MFTRSQQGFKWTLTEASLMMPSPAASLAILLMIGETFVGPYSWILGRQFWYACTTPWISDQKEKMGETQLTAATAPSQPDIDNICPIIWAWHPCVFLDRKRNLNDCIIYFTFTYMRLAQISIINNHVHRLGLTFAFVVLRVEIYGKVMRNLQTGEGMSRLGSTAAKHE